MKMNISLHVVFVPFPDDRFVHAEAFTKVKVTHLQQQVTIYSTRSDVGYILCKTYLKILNK